jgi:hypothetical protein
VTDTRARLDDLELRVSALEADSERVRSAQEASRVEREASRDHIDFTKAMVLELGQRVASVGVANHRHRGSNGGAEPDRQQRMEDLV